MKWAKLSALLETQKPLEGLHDTPIQRQFICWFWPEPLPHGWGLCSVHLRPEKLWKPRNTAAKDRKSQWPSIIDDPSTKNWSKRGFWFAMSMFWIFGFGYLRPPLRSPAVTGFVKLQLGEAGQKRLGAKSWNQKSRRSLWQRLQWQRLQYGCGPWGIFLGMAKPNGCFSTFKD